MLTFLITVAVVLVLAFSLVFLSQRHNNLTATTPPIPAPKFESVYEGTPKSRDEAMKNHPSSARKSS